AWSGQSRELVAGAAVLGQRFSVAALREVTGLETTGAPIVEAIDAGVLAEVPGTGGRELAFAQVLTREVIYQDLGRGVRTQLHRRGAPPRGPPALPHPVSPAARPRRPPPAGVPRGPPGARG